MTRGGRCLTAVGAMNEHTEKPQGWSWWYLLFLVQFVAVLWPPFYNSTEPTLIGLPFFYWYQLAWVIGAAILTAIVYFVSTPNSERPSRGTGQQWGEAER
jgi:hypothetical protein